MTIPSGGWDRLHSDRPGLRAQLLTLAAAALAVVVLDTAVDAMTRQLSPGITPIVGDVLRLTPRHNDGAAFGLLRGAGPWILVAGAVALVVLVWLAHRSMTWLTLIPVGLFFGGGVANLLERARQGVVLDYLDLGIGTLRWPTFNTSDVAISVGIALMGLAALRMRDPAGKAPTRGTAQATDDGFGGASQGTGQDE